MKERTGQELEQEANVSPAFLSDRRSRLPDFLEVIDKLKRYKPSK